MIGAGVIGLEMGSGVAPPRRRGDGARGAAGVPRRGRRADRQGGAQGLHASRA
ncbi:MAG: hypothetical protein MZW92_34120 [Comamonadaceae bacterium]|nr:hypothetical protein [Comamonadaceae bacterium]